MADETDLSTQLLWKIKNGETLEAETILKNKKDLVNDQIQGRSPLHFAADYGQTEVLETLIKHGANVNAEDKYGLTPLLAAIFEGHTQCVKALIKNGAKKDGKDPNSGNSYLQCAEKDDIKQLLK